MDTVVYKLHKASTYGLILAAVLDLEKKGKGVTKIPIEPSINETPNAPLLNYQDAWMNLQLGTIHFFNYNIKIKLPSSSIGIQVQHDRAKDLIKFEFSLPKYLFANNVCEIIPPYTSRHYNPTEQGMIKLCANYWYNLLKVVFKKVIHELTNGTAANFLWTDVQVSRIDIAFNQIFPNYDDAKFYLESIKRVRVPKGSERMFKAYETGVAFENPRYYWKIYLKGRDFSGTGKNQIMQLFNEFNKDSRVGIIKDFTTKKGDLVKGPSAIVPGDRDNYMIKHAHDNLIPLQDYADRILRYELECRGGLMSYLFNRNMKKRGITTTVNGKQTSLYKGLWKAVFYLCTEQNYPLLRDSRARYIGMDGRVSERPFKGYSYIDWYLPAHYIDDSAEEFKMKKVIDLDQVNRLIKIHATKEFVKKKYGIKDLNELKKYNKFLEKEQSKYHQFFFEIDSTDAATANPYNYGVDHETGEFSGYLDLLDPTETAQKFSPSLLVMLIRKHNKLFTQFQFQKLPLQSEISLKVAALNSNRKNKLKIDGPKEKYGIRDSQVQMIYELLKHSTWDELKKGGTFSAKTIYNWKQKIKKLEGSNVVDNFIQEEFTDKIVKDTAQLYTRHYSTILDGTSPLKLFLNAQPLLLVV